jgi:hypothetical protein
MAGKKGKSGGKRTNSGRKEIKRNFSAEVKGRVRKAAEKLEKEFGYGIEECILRLLYDDKFHPTAKSGIAKWYADVLVTKESEKTITHKGETKPEIYLPKEKEDPAKIIPIDGGKRG